MSRHGRIALVVVLLATLALPAAAQPARSRDTEGIGERLSALWTRLVAPLVALWGTEDGRGIWDPNGNPLPDATFDREMTEGRGIWDPDGLSAS
jgi:hypothetical protein